MASINALCLEWHISNSPAFHDLLVEPLRPYVDIKLRGWDGVSLSADDLGASRLKPAVFCQHPPSPEVLRGPKAPVVWLPMWDHSRHHSQGWWNSLPKWLRVVAFSDAVAQRSERAGLPTLRLRYFVDPALVEPAEWVDGRVLLYWNRTGLIGPRLLARLCRTLRIDKVLFRSQIDPGIPKQMEYRLPARLGDTVVEELKAIKSRDEYLRATSGANVFIAPRAHEGVGLSFLEAMARGCAILAYDAPTMNEYLTHGHNGVLFRSACSASLCPGRLGKPIRRLWSLGIGPRTSLGYYVPECQDWSALSAVDLYRLGQMARKSQEIGFAEWRGQIAEYAGFVLDW